MDLLFHRGGVSLRAEPARAIDEPEIRALLSASGLDDAFDAREFVVVRDGGRVVACARLAEAGDAFELASVAVAPKRRKSGLGSLVTRSALAKAPSGTPVYALALAPGFFARHGFETVALAELPQGLASKISACNSSASPWTPMRWRGGGT